jgi:hypothetical protein
MGTGIFLGYSPRALFPLAMDFFYKYVRNLIPSGSSDMLPSQATDETASNTISEKSRGSFPIYPYFQMPRNFGYHIGDEIPLTLIIEVKKNIILDLVNLPHKGEVHGDFEVRNLKISRKESPNTTIYRIDFTLQTFKPVWAVDSLAFPPLDVLYATSEGKDPLSGEYQYISLLSPPHIISLSRTATYFNQMKAVKGVITEETTWLVWSTVLMGALLWVSTMSSWIRTWYRTRVAKVQPKKKLSPREKALQTITETWEQYIINGGRVQDIFSKANLAFRKYLGEVYSIPTTGKTFLQLKEALQEKPYQVEILELLGKCHAILYEGYIPGRREQEEVIKQFSALIQQTSIVSTTKDKEASFNKAQDRLQQVETLKTTALPDMVEKSKDPEISSNTVIQQRTGKGIRRILYRRRATVSSKPYVVKSPRPNATVSR